MFHDFWWNNVAECICLQVNVSRTWLTFSSIVVAFAFVFGNSIKTVYESVVFLFVVHPFDVGDALLVPDTFYAGQTYQYCKVGHHTDML